MAEYNVTTGNIASTSLSTPDTATTSGSGGTVMEKIVQYTVQTGNRAAAALGTSVKGIVQKADGSAMPGTAKVIEGEDVVGSKDASGQFIVSGAPPSSITTGSDRQASTTRDFRFEIDLDGIDVEKQRVGASADLGRIQYGVIEGAVTDFEGNLLEGEGVSATGAKATTAADGSYSFNAPGGTTVTLNAVGASVSLSPTGGASVTQDFQYAGLRVDIALPTGEGVNGAAVTFPPGESGVSTGEEGGAQFTRVRVNQTGTLSLLDGAIERQVTSNEQGQNKVVNITLGAGFVGDVTDARTNDPVRRCDCRARSSTREAVGATKSDGTYAIGLPSAGEVTVVIADRDSRYQASETTLDLTNGEVSTESFTLERAQNIGQSN